MMIIRLHMDDLTTIDKEYSDETPFNELNAEAFRLIEEYAKYDWYCDHIAIGYENNGFCEIWSAEIEQEGRDPISPEFADELLNGDWSDWE